LKIVGDEIGTDFEFNLGCSCNMRIYLEGLDDEVLELIEFLQVIASVHLSMLRELEIDPLTGALTRKAGEEKLLNMIENGEEFKLVFADLDKLKYINDNFGHEAEDMYLKDFSEAARNVETIIRWGGDEFILSFKKRAKEGLERIKEEFWG
jgi:GGDEF domain-containing protein